MENLFAAGLTSPLLTDSAICLRAGRRGRGTRYLSLLQDDLSIGGSEIPTTAVESQQDGLSRRRH